MSRDCTQWLPTLGVVRRLHVCMPVFWSCSHHVDGQFREGEVSDKSELVVRDTEELDNLLLQWSNNNLHNTHRQVHPYTHKCQSQMSVTNVSYKCQSQMSVTNVSVTQTQ